MKVSFFILKRGAVTVWEQGRACQRTSVWFMNDRWRDVALNLCAHSATVRLTKHETRNQTHPKIATQYNPWHTVMPNRFSSCDLFKYVTWNLSLSLMHLKFSLKESEIQSKQKARNYGKITKLVFWTSYGRKQPFCYLGSGSRAACFLCVRSYTSHNLTLNILKQAALS